MVIAHHLLWSAYGCWLPNDPRGSSSHEIRVPALKDLAELHQGRKPIQPARAVLRQFYEEAANHLQFPIQLLTEADQEIVGDSFASVIEAQNYTCYACAVMPDHVHLLIRIHRHKAEEMIEHFQEQSRLSLINQGHRRNTHPVWGGPGWKVFLDSTEDIERTIRYIEANPTKIGLRPQEWPFVKRYDGWCPTGY